jgi:hypothetical protein
MNDIKFGVRILVPCSELPTSFRTDDDWVIFSGGTYDAAFELAKNLNNSWSGHFQKYTIKYFIVEPIQ